MERSQAERLLAARKAAVAEEAERAARLKALALLAQGVLTIRQAEELSGLKKSTLYKLMGAGRLPYVKLGASRRIPRAALLELLAEHLVGGEG